MKYLILIVFLCSLAYADEERKGERERLLKADKAEDITAKDLNNFPEIYLERQKVIQNRNSRTGVYTEPHYTQGDQSRFSLGYSMSQDYRNLGKVQSIYGTYMNRLDDFYQEMWWALHVKRTQAQFNAIHDDSGARDTNLQSLTTFGTGVGHSFNTFSEIFDTNRLYEAILVFFNYNFHLDSTDDERYQGFGYSAEYSLSYRSTKNFFYGGKFSYNWAQVERPAQGNESLSSRSFSFGWTSLGFEMGFYF